MIVFSFFHGTFSDFQGRNRIFAGLWFGYSKPDFSTFLKPFAESLHDMYLSGM